MYWLDKGATLLALGIEWVASLTRVSAVEILKDYRWGGVGARVESIGLPRPTAAGV